MQDVCACMASARRECLRGGRSAPGRSRRGAGRVPLPSPPGPPVGREGVGWAAGPPGRAPRGIDDAREAERGDSACLPAG